MLPAPLEESVTTARALKARRRIGIGVLGVLLAAGVASCGGTRQDANEPEGNFPVSIVSADFPSKQQLAQNTNLTGGTDTGTSSAPAGSSGGAGNLPTAQGSFSVRSEQEGLAIPFRPVWILEEGFPKLAGQSASAGAEAAQTDTYSFGALAAHQTRQMVWNVTPVQAGTYTVHYRIAAGLEGKAKAVTADGSVPEGEFVVRISSAPPQTRVDDSGKVVPISPSDIIGQAGTKQQKSQVQGGQ
jgi:hypothetical protein